MRTQVLVVSLLWSTVCSQAQEPPKPPPRTETNSAKTAGDKKDSTQDQRPADSKAATIKKQSEAEPGENTAETKPNEELEVNRRLALFTGLLVAVGVIQSFALFWQARVLRHHAELIKESSDETARVAAAAQQTAEAVRKNSEALVNSERAWLTITKVQPPNDLGMQVMVGEILTRYFVVEIVNCGKTIARVQYPIDVGSPGAPLKNFLSEEPYYVELESLRAPGVPEHGRVLAPTESLTVNIPYMGVASSEQVALAEGRGARVYAYARIRYYDFTGTAREFRFCYQHHPAGAGEPECWVLGGPKMYNLQT
jgi:hypothetical protein